MADIWEQIAMRIPLPPAQAEWALQELERMRAAKAEDDDEDSPDGIMFGLTVETIYGGLWIEGDVDLEGLADWWQRIMEKFDIRGAWTVEASFMCNSVKAGTCGGCAMIVTKDDVESMNTGEWSGKRLAERGLKDQDMTS
jgi:hypothetical protein